MSDKLKEIYQIIVDKFFGLASKFDGISEKVFEKTGIKVNIGIIVMSFVFIISIIFFIRILLKFVFNFLFTGEL